MSQLDYVAQLVAVDGNMKALNDFSALADEVRNASDEMRKHACLVACRLALNKTGLQSPLVEDALQLIRESKPVSPKIRRNLSRLAHELDQKYLDLDDAVEDGVAGEDESLLAFLVARAAAAISLAVSAFCKNSSDDLEDSIYEAVQASGQDRGFIASVRAELSTS